MIYVLRFDNPRMKNLIKIGRTRNIQNRLKAYETHSPFKPIVIYKTNVSCLNIEGFIHSTIKCKRYKTEWFKLSEKELSKIIFALKFYNKYRFDFPVKTPGVPKDYFENFKEALAEEMKKEFQIA